ncbi:MAG: hypothetical protein ACR2HV_06750, partial [Acidimicrobiales bacterium]
MSTTPAGRDDRARTATLLDECEDLAGPAHRDERLDKATEVVDLAVRAGDTANELLGRRLRLVALLEGRELAAFDAELDAFAATVHGLGHPGPSGPPGGVTARLAWWVPLWRATRVLLQGRFTECGRQNADAA